MSAGGAPLTIEDFAPRLGESFAVAGDESSAMLTLVEASPLAGSGREGGAFRLEFAGPIEPVLPQAIYPVPVDARQADIFIVPIGPQEGTMRYEALFF